MLGTAQLYGWLLLVPVCSLLSACAASDLRKYAYIASISTTRELNETPFFAQTTNHCGPAVLATLLNHTGR